MTTSDTSYILEMSALRCNDGESVVLSSMAAAMCTKLSDPESVGADGCLAVPFGAPDCQTVATLVELLTAASCHLPGASTPFLATLEQLSLIDAMRVVEARWTSRIYAHVHFPNLTLLLLSYGIRVLTGRLRSS